MNILYKNLYGTSTYPFTTSVPFPTSCISHIKLALKKAKDQPYVSTIAYSEGRLFVLLKTATTYLCNFLLKKLLYATVDNLLVFGFIRIAKMPILKFYFSGNWPLARNCYTYSIAIPGLQRAYVLSTVVEQKYLRLQFAGDFSFREAQNINSNSDNELINVGRNPLNTFQDYIQHTWILLQQLVPGVTSIAGRDVENIIFMSNDRTISIDGPTCVGGNVWVLYVNSLRGFPSCSQSLSSNSYNETSGDLT